MSHGYDTSKETGRKVGREEHAQRSAPPVQYAYASQDPPDPPKSNKALPESNSKTPPTSDY
jgi:hypothetical protein